MKKYFSRIQSKPPHERRQHAIQIASVFTAVVFVMWITTLGLRLAGPGNTAQSGGSSDNQTQLANVGSAFSQQANSLEVATSSDSAQGITLPYAQ